MSGSSSTQSGDGLDGAINNGAGTALKSSGLSFSSFLASIATGAVAFTVQFLIFYFLRARLPRI